MARRYGSYWREYSYFPRSRPIDVKNGLKAKSRTGKIGETWWADRWIAVLESFGMGARLGRGKSYARRGQVLNIDIEPGRVTAKVQGSRRTPYSVVIELKPLSDADWEKVADAMAAQAIFAAKLLAGEMPQNIEEAFKQANLSLFPRSIKDLATDCSCPDWANPCKHIAAVYFLLAERFDDDPFMIFTLRGRAKEEITEMLRARRAGSEAPTADVADESSDNAEAAPPLEECLDTFWVCGNELADVRPQPKPPDVEGAVMRRLGDAPFAVGKSNLTALLAPAYRARKS